MSFVTGVTLHFENTEGENGEKIVAEINEWLGDSGSLTRVSGYYGGTKTAPVRVYGAGVNYLKINEFARFVASRDWEFPESVVLILHPEEGRTIVRRPKVRRTKNNVDINPSAP